MTFHPRDFRRGLRHAGLTHGEYRVAVELAEFSNRDEPIVWPSVATLAEICGMTERGVQGILSSLTAKGVTVCVDRSTGGRGNTNRWRLLVATPNHRSGFTEAETPNETAQKPRTKLRETPNPRSPEVVRRSFLEGVGGTRARAREREPEPLDVEIVPNHSNEPPPATGLSANGVQPLDVEPASREVIARRIGGLAEIDAELVYGDLEPELYCERHSPHGTDRPCVGCKKQRQHNEAWQQEQEDLKLQRFLADAAKPARPAGDTIIPAHRPPSPVPPTWIDGPHGPRCLRHGHLKVAPAECIRCQDAAIAARASA